MAKNNFSEIIKDINWNRVILTVIPLLQPFIIFGSWVMFARLNRKAGVVSKLVAIAEVIPTIDLGVPKEVVLASLYDFTDDTLDLLDSIIETILDPVGIEQTKNSIKVMKEILLEGETTVEIETGSGTFGQKVTRDQLVDSIIKFFGVEDDVIRGL
jgi:hypothetical protein